jgi:hypothetical protein
MFLRWPNHIRPKTAMPQGLWRTASIHGPMIFGHRQFDPMLHNISCRDFLPVYGPIHAV